MGFPPRHFTAVQRRGYGHDTDYPRIDPKIISLLRDYELTYGLNTSIGQPAKFFIINLQRLPFEPARQNLRGF